jgi:DNA polymerase-1
MGESRSAFLIDGTAFCYRAFHAIPGLATSDGRPTNAVYGFARMLRALMDQRHPDFLAVAFDVGKPTFRHRQFEAYKIQRKPMPDQLIGQLPLVKRLLAAHRVPLFEQEGYEAEDVLATIARQIAGRGVTVYLVTGDKDALQLVNSHVKVYNPHSKGEAILDAEAVKARYGVAPERVVDLMALMGDDIDNIPSVPGIGEKTASQLLRRFGSLAQLYRRLDEVENPARRSALATHREQVEQARELAQIRADAPLTVALEDLACREPDWTALRALYRELEFKRLLEEADERAPAAPLPAVRTQRLTSLRQLEPRLQETAAAPAAALWCSAVSESAATLAVAVRPDEAWIVELTADVLDTPFGKRLATWLEDAAAPKLGHDAKASMRALARLGVTLRGLAGDTMVAAHLLNPARTNQTLSDLSAELLDEPLPAPLRQGQAGLPATKGPAGEEALLPDVGEAEPWLGRACGAILRLHALLLPRLRQAALDSLYAELELPLLGVLAAMEARGIAVDIPYLQGLSASMASRLAQLTQEVYRLAGGAFNVNSPKQLAQVLFERLRLPVLKRTKTGPSTDSDVLQRLAAQHPLPATLIQYRELAKLTSTYVEALPKLVNPATGRLHTSFNQTATATGRLSSSGPNLQNIPVKTELGRLIRKAFVPGIPDGTLLAADYSQVELRVLAHVSGDERLREAFRQGRDIHRVTASLIYGLPESEVQPEQRNAMKAVNFGILYGMSAHGLAAELGMPVEEAQAFIAAYFERYPKVRAYLDAQIAQARRSGFVQTLLGRRRYIPEVNSPDGMIRQFGERMAINAPIQGTAADLIKRAMIRLEGAIEREGLKGRMLLQVHDELVFETPRAQLERLAALVRRLMEGAIELDVPLTVTLKAGPNWLEMTDFRLQT